MVCISQFATAILSGGTGALGTIRVKCNCIIYNHLKLIKKSFGDEVMSEAYIKLCTGNNRREIFESDPCSGRPLVVIMKVLFSMSI